MLLRINSASFGKAHFCPLKSRHAWLQIPAVTLIDSNNQRMRPLDVFAPLELDAGVHAPQRVDDAHPVYAEPARGALRGELRKNLLVEPPQLTHLVLYGSQEDPLDPCCLELAQLFGALSIF
jgi:hypothetical protein